MKCVLHYKLERTITFINWTRIKKHSEDPKKLRRFHCRNNRREILITCHAFPRWSWYKIKEAFVVILIDIIILINHNDKNNDQFAQKRKKKSYCKIASDHLDDRQRKKYWCEVYRKFLLTKTVRFVLTRSKSFFSGHRKIEKLYEVLRFLIKKTIKFFFVVSNNLSFIKLYWTLNALSVNIIDIMALYCVKVSSYSR